MKPHHGGRAGFIVLLVSGLALAQSPPRGVARPAEEAPQAPRSGPAAALGLMQANGLGPWIQASWQLRGRIVGLLEGTAGLGLGYTFNTDANDQQMGYPRRDIVIENEQRILMLPLDLFLELRLVRGFGVTFGGTAGLASNAARATHCGTRTFLAGYVGFRGGLAVHFGEGDAYTLGAHVQNATLPILRCNNGGLDPITGDRGFPSWFLDRDFEPFGGAVSFGAPW